MSKIKVQSPSSGTAVFTLTTASGTTTDRTITLPDSTGTVLMTDGDGSNLTNVGVDGIVSTANATAITIDSSERVGIGSTGGGNDAKLHVNGHYGGRTLILNDNVNNNMNFTHSSGNITLNANGSTNLKFTTAGVERLNLTNDGRGLSQFTAKAWCNFDGTGSAASWERDSHNVSSYTDHGTGEYTINWDNDLANANYSVTAMCNNLSWGGMPNIASEASAFTTGHTKIKLFHNNSTGKADASYVCLQVFGD